MTDLDERIHEDLERLVTRAPLPPSVEDILDRRPAVERRRRPVLVGLAAAAVLALFVGGAVALRQAGDNGGSDDGVAATTPAESERIDLVVTMNLQATDAQVQQIDALLDGDPRVEQVTAVSPEAFFEELRPLLVADTEPAAAIAALSPSFRVDVAPMDPGALDAFLTELRVQPGVQDVALDVVVPEVPAALAGQVALPWLRVDLPGWTTGEPPREEPGSGTAGVSDERRIVYAPEGEYLPLLEVITTDGDYGLGMDNRDVVVAGRPAVLSPRYGLWQTLGWTQGGETTALNAFGLEESELLTAAEALVRQDDVVDGNGMWILPDPPVGMVERYRTTSSVRMSGPSYAEHRIAGPDGAGLGAYATAGGAASFWSYASDAMASAVEVDTVMVRGVPGVLTFDGSGYRVDWLEPGGAVAMRIDFYIEDLDRTGVDEILAHLVEVEPGAAAEPSSTTDSLVTETPSTTTTCVDVETAASVPGLCPGAVDSALDPAEGCDRLHMAVDTDGDGTLDDCVRVRDGG